MRLTFFLLAGLLVLLAAGAGAASASSGTEVAFTSQFLFPGGPGTVGQVVVTTDPAGALCPTAINESPADDWLPLDVTAAGPGFRGSSTTFVGTAIRTFHCQGEGWNASDTYSIRNLVKGNNDGLTADGTWNIVGGTGRLAGLHGGGEVLETLAFFPVVTEYFTGSVHLDPS